MQPGRGGRGTWGTAGVMNDPVLRSRRQPSIAGWRQGVRFLEVSNERASIESEKSRRATSCAGHQKPIQVTGASGAMERRLWPCAIVVLSQPVGVTNNRVAHSKPLDRCTLPSQNAAWPHFWVLRATILHFGDLCVCACCVVAPHGHLYYKKHGQPTTMRTAGTRRPRLLIVSWTGARPSGGDNSAASLQRGSSATAAVEGQVGSATNGHYMLSYHKGHSDCSFCVIYCTRWPENGRGNGRLADDILHPLPLRVAWHGMRGDTKLVHTRAG